ncbi:J domain-containing protein [Parerythrobacter aestuarii]|uniref:molecular chaperone DnaJ n=1 Tax=Parerythrobacter aestuarii TaxID=3020909 RepID=UPI0024DE43E5|nr:molecular chaperone DnaJ [Parerythrobacter aestuarii]
MIRLLIIAAVLSVLCRWAVGKWPWQYLSPARSTRSQAVFRARRLLAVRENANRTEIISAHKRLVAMVHPDRGGSNEQVHEANAARDLLLDELPDGGPPA